MGLFGKSIEKVIVEVQLIKAKNPDIDLFVNEIVEEKKKISPALFKDSATLEQLRKDYRSRTMDMLVDAIINEAKRLGKEKEIRQIIEKKVSIFKYLIYIKPDGWKEFYEKTMSEIEDRL